MTATSRQSKMAFVDAISPCLDVAYQVAAQLTESSSQAEDCLAEAAILGSRAQPDFETDTDIRPVFLGLVLQRCRSRHGAGDRPAQTAAPSFEDSLPLYEAAQSATWFGEESDPAAELFARLSTSDVSNALRSLPFELRQVAALYYVAEFSYAELAKALNLSLSLVRARLHQARREMQRAMCVRAREIGILPAA